VTRTRPPRPGLIGPFSSRQVGIVAALAILVAAGALVLNQPVLGPASTGLPNPQASFFLIGPPTEGLRPGQTAPELEGDIGGRHVTLSDLGGRPIRLADLRGRPVWLNFWASWCPPCQAETPVLRDVYERHKREGLALVAVAVQETTPDDVRAYAQTYGLEYTIGFDGTSAIFHRYAVFGLPTQFFIDRAGIVRSVVLGPVDVANAERDLAPILGPLASASPSSSP
jgi:cytochrome c biogenesis protein CcmG, thiol:disulfide interchange protein DsbE